ncbi:AAA domain-containing protein [Nocardia sp. NPDC004654]|uniref:AAA domain-containing protein n=1 Tax=Nocardia sp. NPDC004654 TaxID=3154776 RepID=UPI0033A8EAEA
MTGRDAALADRGERLFKYLARVQDIGVQRIPDVADLGTVIWLSDLPIHPVVRYEPDALGLPFLVVRKVRLEPVVELNDQEVRAWLSPGRLDDPENEPELRETRPGTEGVLQLSDHPEVVERFELWLAQWRPWAAKTRRDLLAHRLYRDLYDVYTQLSVASETTEAVLGLGCLSWKPSARRVRRHVLTIPVKIEFDTDSGDLSVTIEAGGTGLTVELMDFLENSQLSAPTLLSDAEDFARRESVDPFDRPAVGGLVRRVINCIDPGAAYVDEMTVAPAGAEPTASYAPALILRPRGKRGLVRVLTSIAQRIREQGEVPEGIRNLVDPDYEPQRDKPSDEGAIVRDGTDSFLPMPLNEVQLRILDHVDTSAHTIVQGPPGTGKTHTAAALIAHLLAQGKRVLVTAHTDRALEEVRGKLPDAIKPLSVAVVGTSRDSFADLEVAVERISEAAAEHDPTRSARQISAAQRRITDLRQQRADIMRRLKLARESEVRHFDIAGYQGTLTEIVSRHRADRERLGWIEGLATPRVDEALPVTAEEFAQWRSLLLDDTLHDPEASVPGVITTAELPPPVQVEQWLARRAAAAERYRDYQQAEQTAWARRISELAPAARAELRELVQSQDRAGEDLAEHRETWIRTAVFDFRAGQSTEWQARAERIKELLVHVETAVAAMGISEVTVDGGDLGALVSLAEALQARIAKKGEIKTQADGSPKIGFATAKEIKDAKPLFDRVRVDGRVPTTTDQLEKFRHYEQAGRLLNQLDAVWSGITQPLQGGTPSGRLAWHRERQARLQTVMSFGAVLQDSGRRLREHGLQEPDWADAESVHRMVRAFDAVTSREELRAAQEPIDHLRDRLAALCNDPRATVNVQDLYSAIEQGEARAYHLAHNRLAELQVLREKLRRRDGLAVRVAEIPLLRTAIHETASDSEWEERLAALPAAWGWAAVGTWLDERSDEQVNELFDELDSIEDGLRSEATTLAVTRAWDRAVGPGRLTNTSRADLRQYVQLVRKLGKGKGIHAGRRQADIKQTLARCRSAVPVWIMPIYRVVEQLDIEQDMFDVVVVDEASQAGLESVFLQYLAPRIVVIGDDKQVSPSGVGVDQNELAGLATQYLFDDKFRASWQEPKRSLFDEATMRFPARLTLVEHRRCVPEIIGFSNRIAYEPQNVRLIPVRLFGADRLPPIRTVHVADGVSKPNNTNENEANRIVEQIARCMDDPDYEGKTFGVISLLGAAQAKVIWDKLLLRFQPEELARRQLRCGDAADFQGAERDVIFLSMVKARGPETRLVAQTRDEIVQRYNVAVSRARDQLWVFHSVTLEELTNPSDMRYRLLDYCLDAQQQTVGHESERAGSVPEDRVVAPFESLFEQQVFNRIVDRGYQVAAHYDATGYDIDMVVTGAQARVAIQCDGDRWDGPEAFEADLARQRDLQRCGWPFVRIRQSQFLRDPAEALTPLWKMFEELGLQPIAEETAAEHDGVRPNAQPSPVHAASGSGFGADQVRGGVVARDDPSAADELSSELIEIDTPPAQDVSVRTHPEPPSVDVPLQAPASEPDGDAPDERAARTVRPYRMFTEPLPEPDVVPARTVAKHLRRIVTTEGPVSGARVLAAYLRASGPSDFEDLPEVVDRLLTEAVRRGELIVDDPLELGDPSSLTYRIPGQPLSDWRTLGPRTVEEVPVRELAEIMAFYAAQVGWEDRKRLMRSVLGAIGQADLTDHAIAALALVLPLARTLAGDIVTARS